MQQKKTQKIKSYMREQKSFKMGGLLNYLGLKKVIGDKGLVHQVQCKVCTHVEGK
jgi:hypothetical protein